MKFAVLILSLVFGSFVARAEEEAFSAEESVPTPVATSSVPMSKNINANNTFQNGHNLSATSDVLESGHCIMGLEILACGVTDSVTIGGSPWMYIDYNMYSLAARVLISEDAEKNRWAFQLNYFKTYKERAVDDDTLYEANYYQMEAVWLMFIRTLTFDDHYRLHLNFHANYYIDERMPFSLRRPFMEKTPYQFNFTLLHEVDLVDGWFIFGEMGVLDLARNQCTFTAASRLVEPQEVGTFIWVFRCPRQGRLCSEQPLGKIINSACCQLPREVMIKI